MSDSRKQSGDVISNMVNDIQACLDVPLHELPAAFERAEMYIADHLHRALLDAIETWCVANNVEFKIDPIQDVRVSIGRLAYRVLMTPDPTNTSTLAVTINCMVRSQSKPSWPAIDFALEPVSPFSKIRMRTEERLSPVAAVVGGMLSETVNEAYKALEHETRRLIARENGELIEDLYGVLRRALPLKVAHKIWLYLIRNSHGVFVLDPLASNTLLEQAREYGSGNGVSPSWVLSRIGGAFSPPEKTIDVQVVIPAGHTVTYDPIKKPASEDLIIALPQHIMSGGGAEAVQPLIGLEHGALETSATWLTAVYPVQLRPHVEKHLSDIGDKLIAIVWRYAEETKRAGRSVPRSGRSSANVWGKFTGSLLSSLIKGMSEP